MKFEKALKQLRKGKQVRLVDWPKGHYLVYDSTGNIQYYDNKGDIKYYLYLELELEHKKYAGYWPKLSWSDIWSGKWEICQISKIETFDFNQAKEALERAGRVSRLAWLNDHNPKDTDYLLMDRYGFIYTRNSEGINNSYSLDRSDLNANDWCLHNDL